MSELDQAGACAPVVSDAYSIGVIDVECLINEVKKYPSLYSQSDSGLAFEDGWQEEWNRVCSALFSQWNTLCPEEKFEKLSAVQRKWKELTQIFFNGGSGSVQHLSPAAKKKRQQRFESMSFLLQTDTTSDTEMCYLQKENNVKCTDDVDSIPDFEHPGNMADSPSPPEHFTDTKKFKDDLEDFNDFLRTYQRTPQEDDPVDEYPRHLNLQFSQILVSLLNHLHREQLLIVWPKIVNIIKEATEPKKKIIILQNELKYRSGEGPMDFGPPYPQVHMPSVVEHYTPQLGPNLVDHYSAQLQGANLVDQYSAQMQGASLVDQYSAQLQGANLVNPYSIQMQGSSLPEIKLPLIQDMESLPPPSHGRPTNERGEIIYPETDTEELDDL